MYIHNIDKLLAEQLLREGGAC